MLTTVIINLNCILTYEDNTLSDATLVPYADVLLSSIAKNYIDIIIISEKNQDITNSALQRNKIFRYINAIFYDADTDSVDDILEELGVSPSEALLIDASETGLLSAHNASVASIEYKPKPSDKYSKASVVVEGYEEIDYEFINTQFLRHNHLPVTITSTSRLIIRELTALDIYDLYNIYNNPCITKYIKPLDMDVETEVLKHIAYIDNVYSFYGYGLWGVFLKENNKLIGRCGIQNTTIDNDVITEIGYMIDSSYQRQGYAYEAMTAIINYSRQQYGIEDFYAIINKQNLPSLNLAAKLSMIMEKEIQYEGQRCILFHLLPQT